MSQKTLSQNPQREKALLAAAEKVMAQADAAQGKYGVPVDPEVAEFMGIGPCDDISGHEDD